MYSCWAGSSGSPSTPARVIRMARALRGRGCQARTRRGVAAGPPRSPIVSSMNLLVHASATIAMIALTWVGATCASCRETTRETAEPPPLSAPDVTGLVDRAAQRERRLRLGRQQVHVGEHTAHFAEGETTGTCRIPRFSISSITSPPKRSGVTVNAGALIALVMVASAGHSVGHHGAKVSIREDSYPPSSRRISAASLPDCDIRRAASRSVTSGSHTSGSPRIRLAACCWAGSTFADSDPGPLRPGEQAAGDEAQAGRPLEKRDDRIGGQPVAEGVLLARPRIRSAAGASRHAEQLSSPSTSSTRPWSRSSTLPRRTTRTLHRPPGGRSSCPRRSTPPPRRGRASSTPSSRSSKAGSGGGTRRCRA